MNNVGFVAVDDFCRNVATDEELTKLKAAIAYREQELARRKGALAQRSNRTAWEKVADFLVRK
jgi:hypothetical protein